MGRFDNVDLKLNEKRMILHHYRAVKETLTELKKDIEGNEDRTEECLALDVAIKIVEDKINSLKENASE